jgi:hypothetical protein
MYIPITNSTRSSRVKISSIHFLAEKKYKYITIVEDKPADGA